MRLRKNPARAAGAAIAAGAALAIAGCAATDSAGTAAVQDARSSLPAPFAPRTVTVVGTGDILIHNTLWFQAQADAAKGAIDGMDFAPQLAGIKDLISSADVGVCNQETPIAAAGGPYASASSTSVPYFSTPRQIVAAERQTGYDTCSITSVHAIDQGYAGVVRTIDAMERNGINWAGANRTEAEAGQMRVFERGGVKFAHLAYSDGFNGNTEPADKPWSYQDWDVKTVLAEAQRAREAGAEIVILSVHNGDEYSREPSKDQLKSFKKIADTGLVNIIYGVGSHVVAPVEKIGNTWVTYGLGNLISGQEDIGHRREGVAVKFTLQEQTPGTFQVTAGEGYPLYNQPSPMRLINLAAKLPAQGGPARWREAHTEVKQTLLARGAAADGFTVRE